MSVIGSDFSTNMFFTSTGWRIYHVDDASLHFRTLLCARHVPWSNVRDLERLGERYRWLPRGWKRVVSLRYVTVDGAHKSLLVYPDMVNADRLLTSVREKLDRRPDEGVPYRA
jgi:hypothetical protein